MYLCKWTYLVLISGVLCSTLRAERSEEAAWGDTETLEFHLLLGEEAKDLDKGSNSYNQVFRNALASWDQYLDIQLQAQLGSGEARLGDGINQVSFATSVEGQDISEIVGIVLINPHEDGIRFLETDIVLNADMDWNYFEGDIDANSADPKLDLYRFCLFFIGKALGLRSGEELGVSIADSVLNPAINIPHELSRFDISFGQAVYGAAVTFPPLVEVSPREFSFKIKTKETFSSAVTVTNPTQETILVKPAFEGPTLYLRMGYGITLGPGETKLIDLVVTGNTDIIGSWNNKQFLIFQQTGDVVPIDLYGEVEARPPSLELLQESPDPVFLSVFEGFAGREHIKFQMTGDYAWDYALSSDIGELRVVPYWETIDENVMDGMWISFDVDTAGLTTGMYHGEITLSLIGSDAKLTAPLALQVLPIVDPFDWQFQYTDRVDPDTGWLEYRLQITTNADAFFYGEIDFGPDSEWFQRESDTYASFEHNYITHYYWIDPDYFTEEVQTVEVSLLSTEGVNINTAAVNIWRPWYDGPRYSRDNFYTRTFTQRAGSEPAHVLLDIDVTNLEGIDSISFNVSSTVPWIMLGEDSVTLEVTGKNLNYSLPYTRYATGLEDGLYEGTIIIDSSVDYLDATSTIFLEVLSGTNAMFRYSPGVSVELPDGIYVGENRELEFRLKNESPEDSTFRMEVKSPLIRTEGSSEFHIKAGEQMTVPAFLDTREVEPGRHEVQLFFYDLTGAIDFIYRRPLVVQDLDELIRPTEIPWKATLTRSDIQNRYPVRFNTENTEEIVAPFKLILKAEGGVVLGEEIYWGFNPDTQKLDISISGWNLPYGIYPVTVEVSNMEGDLTHEYPGIVEYGQTEIADRLINISTRGLIKPGAEKMIAGLINLGSASKTVYLRGLGPSLAASGVANVMTDPVLTLYDGQGAKIDDNDSWNEVRSNLIDAGIPEAFWPSDAREAVLLADLEEGSFTLHLDSAGGEPGNGIVEVYEVAEDGGFQFSELINLSTRAFVGKGDSVLIGGFIISGDLPREIFIRGIGPSLAEAGLEGVLEDPVLSLFDSNGRKLLTNNDWVDAGPLDLALNHLRESSIIEVLLPGAYTVILSGNQNRTGIGSIEIYALPN